MRDYSEAGKNKNIYFGVAKEPEQVLVKDWVPSPSGVEEGGVKVTICQEHGNAGCEDGERKEEQDRRDKH